MGRTLGGSSGSFDENCFRRFRGARRERAQGRGGDSRQLQRRRGGTEDRKTDRGNWLGEIPIIDGDFQEQRRAEPSEVVPPRNAPSGSGRDSHVAIAAADQRRSE